MAALHKVGAVVMGVGGILLALLGIFVWAGTAVAWYEGLTFLVLGVGLLLWGIAAVFGKETAGGAVGAAGRTPERERV